MRKKEGTSLRRAAVAAITVASFSVSTVTIAYAQQTADATPAAANAAKKHARSHYSQNQTHQRKLYGYQPYQNMGPPPQPYQNMFPPYMSTWPEGSPHYHGGIHPGVTFDE